MRHKKNDCGCGKKAKCITKSAINRWVKSEMKRLDCGCGCKGAKGFNKKYSGGAVLADCPPGWRNDGLTCVAPCASEERCDFDWEKYARANPDVVAAVGNNESGMRWHYDVAGKQEGRSPCGNEPTRVSTEDDDGMLTCKSRCAPGQVDDGLLCRNPIQSSIDPCPEGSNDVAGTCWGKVGESCVDDCFNKPAPGCRTYECGRLRGAFGEDWGPQLCTDCNLRCGQTCSDVIGVTRGLAERNLRTWGGEVFTKTLRTKEIRGRVNFDELNKELVTGLTYLFSDDGPLASSFDPEKNGVNDAFRKFGDDMNAVLNDINNRIKDGFNKMGDDARRAFEDLAKNAERDFKQFGDDFVAKMKDPDFWVEAIGIMAMIAGAAVSILVTVGTLGAGGPLAVGIMAAASMAGPAAKMIADGARGKPIDALDIAAIAVAGATAFIPGLGPTAAGMLKTATTAASFAIAATRTAQTISPLFGVDLSTCVGNCPKPDDSGSNPFGDGVSPNVPCTVEPPACPPPRPGQISDIEILKLQPANQKMATLKKVEGRPRNPEYKSPLKWLAEYKCANYKECFDDNPDAPVESPEDKAIREASQVTNPPESQLNAEDVPLPDPTKPVPPTVDGDSTFSFGDAPAVEGDSTFSFGDAPAVEGDSTFNFGDMGDSTFNFGDAPAVDGDSTFNFGDAPAVEGDSTFNFGDAPAVEGDSTFNFGETPAEPAPSTEPTPSQIPAETVKAPAYDNNKIYSLGDLVTGSDGIVYKMIDGIGAPGYPPPRPTNWQPIVAGGYRTKSRIVKYRKNKL